MAGLGKCSCLIEYEKNLLISALASYKAELNDWLLKLLGPRHLLSGTTVGDEFHSLIGSRISYIDEIITRIENTPKCPTSEEEEVIKRRLAGYSS